MEYKQVQAQETDMFSNHKDGCSCGCGSHCGISCMEEGCDCTECNCFKCS